MADIEIIFLLLCGLFLIYVFVGAWQLNRQDKRLRDNWKNWRD